MRLRWKLRLAASAALLGGCQGAPPPVPQPTPLAIAPQPLAKPAAPKLVLVRLPPVEEQSQLAATSPEIATAHWESTPAHSSSVQPASALQPAPPPQPLPDTGYPPIAQPGRAEPIPTPIVAAVAPGLSLFDAVELGLAQNPDLNALRYAEGASEGALGVAQTYPFNPWVQIQVTPGQHSQNPDTNVGPVAHYVLLMQQLQLAHQRRHRTAAAAAALNSVRWNFVQAKLVNVATTQRLYFAALYQRGLADVARQNADLSGQTAEISQKRLAAGQISGADAAIVKLDAAAARRQALVADANYQTALLDLRRQLGLQPGAALAVAGNLSDWRWQPVDSERPTWTPLTEMALPVSGDKELLARSLASGRPDVWAAASDVEAARAGVDLARANRVPDLQIGPYYARTNDPTSYWGFRAQMDLPVLNNGNPMVRQRLAELTQRHATWEQLLYRATLDAYAALDRYERALTLANDAAAPEQLPDELRKLETQFQAGDIDLVRVITARTSLIQGRRAALDALNEVAQASAAVVAATGLPPEALLAPAK